MIKHIVLIACLAVLLGGGAVLIGSSWTGSVDRVANSTRDIGGKQLAEAQSLLDIEPAAGEDVVVIKQPHKTSQKKTVTGSSSIGGAFSLIDHHGNAVTDKDYADKHKLIFFGFSHCPEICPTELQKLSKVLDKLDDSQADQIYPLFISTDPERDTPEVLEQYISHFTPRLIGLTGSQEQIDNVLQTYRVYAEKVDDPDLSEYTMNHSAYLYFMTADNELINIYATSDHPENVAHSIAQFIK